MPAAARGHLRGLTTGAVAALLAACASSGPPVAPFTPCLRVALDPAPLWTAAASWTPAGDALLLVDPGSRSLLRFDPAGRLLGRVELEAGVELDLSFPLRLQASPNGYLLSGRHLLVWLGSGLEVLAAGPVTAELAPGAPEEILLSDIALLDDALLAFADYPVNADDWRRGFVLLRRGGAFEPLLELPVGDAELTEYYHYDRRPFLVRLGEKAYALRLRQPAELLQLRRGRLVMRAELELPGGYRAQSLHASEGRLFVLAERFELEGGGGGEPVAPRLESAGPEAAAALLKLSRAEAAHRRQWLVQEVDPRSGRLLGRYPLPSTSMRLRLLPGPRYWVLLEERLAPSIGESAARRTAQGAEGTRLLRLDARRFAPLPAGEESAVLCPESAVLESGRGYP